MPRRMLTANAAITVSLIKLTTDSLVLITWWYYCQTFSVASMTLASFMAHGGVDAAEVTKKIVQPVWVCILQLSALDGH